MHIYYKCEFIGVQIGKLGLTLPDKPTDSHRQEITVNSWLMSVKDKPTKHNEGKSVEPTTKVRQQVQEHSELSEKEKKTNGHKH